MTESFKTLISTTIGWSLIGGFFSAMLSGVSYAQTLYYFRHFPHDRWELRSFVCVLCILDTVRTAMSLATIWTFVIHDHGNLIEVQLYPSIFSSQYFLGGIMMILVQFYFINTIYAVIRHKWYRYPVVISMAAMSLLALSITSAITAKLKQGDFIVEAVDSVAVLGCVELGAFAIADIEIAVALCLAMWNERTGFMRTDYLISRIFIFSVNRGIITVALELVELGTLAATFQSTARYNLVWTAFHYMNSKVYTNALLALLNAREHWREGGPSKHMNLLENIRLPIMTTQDVGHRSDSSERRCSVTHTQIMVTSHIVQDTVAV